MPLNIDEVLREYSPLFPQGLDTRLLSRYADQPRQWYLDGLPASVQAEIQAAYLTDPDRGLSYATMQVILGRVNNQLDAIEMPETI